jgi:hypothetical protein
LNCHVLDSLDSLDSIQNLWRIADFENVRSLQDLHLLERLQLSEMRHSESLYAVRTSPHFSGLQSIRLKKLMDCCIIFESNKSKELPISVLTVWSFAEATPFLYLLQVHWNWALH